MAATLTSWIAVSPDSSFPIQNLPIGIFSTANTAPHAGVAIGEFVLDLLVLHQAGLLSSCGFDTSVFGHRTLNKYMELERSAWRGLRSRLTDLLSTNGDAALRDNASLRAVALIPLSSVTMHLPAEIGDYTDFYSSREHATNVGIMFRGVDNALQPNWLHLPVGYHGRASSVVVSGTDIVRPRGQVQIDKENPKLGSQYSPCRLLDFELEMAFFVGGPANELGRPLTMAEAEDRIFGLVLMNDWSARDLQAWEYVPLGPFTAKNFATSISPWIVSLDALEPFRCSTSAGAAQEPTPLPYLQDPNYATSTYDVALDVAVQGANDTMPSVISKSNFKYMYWNMKQQLVHHSVTGCNMRAGDLLGSGTISGQDETAYGSMLELSWRGAKEIPLSNASSSPAVRKFLQDGDVVIMTGHAQGAGYRIGFGEVSGRILPAGSKDQQTAAPAVSSERYSDFKLYSYWRSSCSWRVRVALALKGIAYTSEAVNLLDIATNNTASLPEAYQAVNPMAQVPTLVLRDTSTGETLTLTQSLAIVEFLDEAYPSQSPLLPSDPVARARAREIAEIVNSGTHPYQNLTILRQVKQAEITGTGEVVDGRGFGKVAIEKALAVLEKKVSPAGSGRFAVGTATPTIADITIVPQLYNARRFGIDTEKYPNLAAIEKICVSLPAFAAAAPEAQPDATK